MQGYTRLHATGTGAGAREVLDAVVREYDGSGAEGSPPVVGEVSQVYNRSAYVEFDVTVEATPGPPMVLLGGPEFDGPLATRLDLASHTGRRRSALFDGLAVAAGDQCRIRTAVDAGGGADRFVISVGGSLDVVLDRDLLRPLEDSVPQYNDVGSIAPGGEVWSRARDALRWLDRRQVEDGLGWRPDLQAAVDEGHGNEELRTLARGWTEVLSADGEPSTEALTTVLGRGPGATPSGDDVVSGILLALYRTTSGRMRQRVARAGERVVARADGRTTTVSTALLAQAGRTSNRVETWLEALLGPSTSERCWTDALADAIELGHTSGADTVLGSLIAVLLVCPSVGQSES